MLELLTFAKGYVGREKGDPLCQKVCGLRHIFLKVGGLSVGFDGFHGAPVFNEVKNARGGRVFKNLKGDVAGFLATSQNIFFQSG